MGLRTELLDTVTSCSEPLFDTGFAYHRLSTSNSYMRERERGGETQNHSMYLLSLFIYSLLFIYLNFFTTIYLSCFAHLLFIIFCVYSIFLIFSLLFMCYLYGFYVLLIHVFIILHHFSVLSIQLFIIPIFSSPFITLLSCSVIYLPLFTIFDGL